MKTLIKLMRNMGIPVIVFLAATIFNLLVVTKSSKYSLIIQLGRVIRVENLADPSLRVLFLQSVQKIPKYKMISDLHPSDIITKDKKIVTANSLAIWDISDPVKYLVSLNTNREKVEVRLKNVVYDSIGDVLSSTSQADTISGRDGSLARTITENIGDAMDPCGIHIYAVETKKPGLPDPSRESVYQRTISGRNSIAAQCAADGNYQSSLIKNETDKTVKETVVKANAEAEKIKAESEAGYVQILSDVYNDGTKADFHNHVRSLDVLKTSMRGDNKTVIPNEGSELTRILSGSW